MQITAGKQVSDEARNYTYMTLVGSKGHTGKISLARSSKSPSKMEWIVYLLLSLQLSSLRSPCHHALKEQLIVLCCGVVHDCSHTAYMHDDVIKGVTCYRDAREHDRVLQWEQLIVLCCGVVHDCSHTAYMHDVVIKGVTCYRDAREHDRVLQWEQWCPCPRFRAARFDQLDDLRSTCRFKGCFLSVNIVNFCATGRKLLSVLHFAPKTF